MTKALHFQHKIIAVLVILFEMIVRESCQYTSVNLLCFFSAA